MQAFQEKLFIATDDGDEIEVLCTRTCEAGKTVS